MRPWPSISVSAPRSAALKATLSRNPRIVAVALKEFFVFPPDRHRVYLRYAAVQAGDEELLFPQGSKVLLEVGRQLHPALVVQPPGIHAPRRFDHQQLLT